MVPALNKRRSRTFGESKSGHDTSSIPSKESFSSRVFIVEQVRVFILRLKLATLKRTNTTTDDGSGTKDIHPRYELEVTDVKVELEAPFDTSPHISSRPSGYGGVGSMPRSQRPGSGRAHSGTSYTQGPTTPSHGSDNLYTIGTGLGQVDVPPSAYYEPDYPSIPQKALLWGNTTITNDVQVIGADVGPSCPEDIRQVTANIHAQENVHSGMGSQIIGQRVKQGAQPRLFAGTYTNNMNKTGGEQILGIVCH
ncbi:hypothetical protein F5Y09DRAFT_317145 [Xylaria sp. FL1042]|nr:hypothetical protein F5Y09DRAFT_317145 [Xylaria sp. FL1042]